MSEVRFIRKNGRVIPIRAKNEARQKSDRRKAIGLSAAAGAVAVGSTIGKVVKEMRKSRVIDTAKFRPSGKTAIATTALGIAAFGFNIRGASEGETAGQKITQGAGTYIGQMGAQVGAGMVTAAAYVASNRAAGRAGAKAVRGIRSFKAGEKTVGAAVKHRGSQALKGMRSKAKSARMKATTTKASIRKPQKLLEYNK